MRHYHSVETECRKFVIDTAVISVLHCKHPAQIHQNFVQNVGQGVFAFGNVEVEFFTVIGVKFYRVENFPDRNRGVDDVFVVIACIVPAARRRNNVAFLAFRTCGRNMNFDFVVWVSGGTGVFAAVFGFYLLTATRKIIRFHGFDRKVVINTLSDGKRIRITCAFAF